MHDPFDRLEYIHYLRRRWRVIGAACGVALLLSLMASLLLPKRYTATATIVIEPPGGNDSRTATAVSPVYLESLKTYERFATSDTLFARAVDRFQLQGDSKKSIESLKQSVLKVSKIRDTKILEISVTLSEPKQAQSVVQYLAEQTVGMSRGENVAADNEMVDESQKQLAEAQARLDSARTAWAAHAASQPTEALQADIESGIELRTKLRQQLVEARGDLADYQVRPPQGNSESAQSSVRAAQQRFDLLEKETQQLSDAIDQKSALLGRRSAEKEALQTELRVAQGAFENTSARLRDLKATAGSRGERLRVIDPGIVPQRPSEPNVGLNVIAALLLALVGSIVYLSLSFGYRRSTAAGYEPALTRNRHS